LGNEDAKALLGRVPKGRKGQIMQYQLNLGVQTLVVEYNAGELPRVGDEILITSETGSDRYHVSKVIRAIDNATRHQVGVVVVAVL
jgi:hypothetical protein